MTRDHEATGNSDFCALLCRVRSADQTEDDPVTYSQKRWTQAWLTILVMPCGC